MQDLKTDQILQEIVLKKKKSLPAKRIYLFGSRTKGQIHQDSDYDFFVLVGDSEIKNLSQLIDQGHRSLKGIKAFVDIIIMTESQFQEQLDVINSIPETVGHEGIELYAS
ncbi:MAG: nucleotidyltransferase domain-containing protein [Bdellovibrionales bacterium]|nr:nucleotidyltransferase domain-containing protein [Bdellovibrionales bacterium]